MNMIVLTGMPASGKSTVAAKLADALSLPVLAKDEFKEALFDTIGFSCYAEKRMLDHAANAVLLKAAEAMGNPCFWITISTVPPPRRSLR